jgi:hypothetical protein
MIIKHQFCNPLEDFLPYEGERGKWGHEFQIYFCKHCGQVWVNRGKKLRMIKLGKEIKQNED